TAAASSPLLAQPPQQESGRAASHQPGMPMSTQMLMQGNGGSLLQASLPAQTESLNAKTPAYSLYDVAEPEPKVLKKHDLVNIIVREESQSNSQGTTDLKRSADLDAKVDNWVYVNVPHMSVHSTGNPVEIKMEGQRDFKGDGTATRTDSVIARIEA